jgi:hypothetical protein
MAIRSRTSVKTRGCGHSKTTRDCQLNKVNCDREGRHDQRPPKCHQREHSSGTRCAVVNRGDQDHQNRRPDHDNDFSYACSRRTPSLGAVSAFAGIHGLSIDTIELYVRIMIDELALRLVHGEATGRVVRLDRISAVAGQCPWCGRRRLVLECAGGVLLAFRPSPVSDDREP